MSSAIEAVVFEVTLQAIDKYYTESYIAEDITDELKKRYGGTWHCIIGNFSSYVYYTSNHYIYFHIGGKYYLIFQSH
jgi:hypothetical protein